MAHLTYLAVLVGCLGCAIWLEPAFGTGVFRQAGRLARTVLPVAIAFVVIDLAAIGAGWWDFDAAQLVGVMLPGGLPIEELLFFLVVPVCAILGFEAARTVLRR